MKTVLFRVFIALYIAVLIALLGFLGICFGSCIGRANSDIYHVEVELENVPEGTVFVDILAKGNWEKQRLADVDNEQLLGIDRNCEIVRYDKDGYKSLMFNTEFFYEGDKIDTERSHNHLCYGGYGMEIFKNLPYVKIAYCDKDGNILGITEEKKTTPVYLRLVQYEFDTDGEELSYRRITHHIYFQMWLLLLFMLMLGVVILMRMPRPENTDSIQSGEIDNESGKQD